MSKTLYLNLDSLWEDGYIYTEYDIGGAGHSVTINEEDKEKFLDAFAQEWRNRVEQALEENIDNEEQELIDAVENKRVYALCRTTILNDEDEVVCIEGKEYLVIDIQDDVFTIETEIEYEDMATPRDDDDFELIFKSE